MGEVKVAFSSLATCPDSEPDRKERGDRPVCDANADFAHAAAGEKNLSERGEGRFLIHEVSSNFATALCLVQDRYSRVCAAEVHKFHDLLPKKDFAAKIAFCRIQCSVKYATKCTQKSYCADSTRPIC